MPPLLVGRLLFQPPDDYEVLEPPLFFLELGELLKKDLNDCLAFVSPMSFRALEELSVSPKALSSLILGVFA